MGDHYVPRWLVKNFAYEVLYEKPNKSEPEIIYYVNQYLKQSNDICKENTIDNIFQKKRYNTYFGISFERDYQNADSKSIPYYKKIIEETSLLSLSEFELHVLAEYLIIQTIRAPRYRGFLRRFFSEWMGIVESKDYENKYISDIHKFVKYKESVEVIFNNYSPMLFVIPEASPREFVICDNPISYLDIQGRVLHQYYIANRDRIDAVSISFPISSKISLCYYANELLNHRDNFQLLKSLKDKNTCITSDSCIDDLNRRQYYNCDKVIASNSKKELMKLQEVSRLL